MVLKRKIHTHWGFPVADGVATSHARRRGVAIIVAVMIISLMMVFTADMIVSSQVNLELVTAARDNIVAEYMSKSGYNLALFLLSIDYGIDLFKQAQMKTPPQDGLGDIWAMVNDIPIGAETVEMLASMQEQFNLNAISDGDVITQLQLFQGEFTITVSDEAAKINVNYCAAGGATTQCKQMRAMLSALFNCPIEKAYLEAKDVDPSVLIAKIKDWVDSDERADPKSGVSSESDPYQRLNPSYRTKNSQFDTIAELKLIDQWDDDLHAVFSPYLTVYPFKKPGSDVEDRARININTVSRELLACLVPESRTQCGETFDLAVARAREDKAPLGENTTQVLRDVLCLPKMVGGERGTQNKANWFSENSPVYKISVKGSAGFQEKTLQAVIKRGSVKEKGRESASYQLLFWKMS